MKSSFATLTKSFRRYKSIWERKNPQSERDHSGPQFVVDETGKTETYIGYKERVEDL